MRAALVAEGVGSALLLAGVVGSGIMAERLSGGNTALALLANAVATGGVLYALIVMFGPISGAHFNPVVTLALTRRGDSAPSRAVPFLAVQLAGAVTVARALTNTFAGIAPGDAPAFILAQALGGLLALLLAPMLDEKPTV